MFKLMPYRFSIRTEYCLISDNYFKIHQDRTYKINNYRMFSHELLCKISMSIS